MAPYKFLPIVLAILLRAKLKLPMPLDCLLIADDLTGACDAAVHFALRGLPTVVPLVPGATDGARVVAISTDSRDLPPAEVRRGISNVAAEYPTASVIFKKIDSTLRGSPGIEIAAALEAFDCEDAVVCPAFPKLHRIVRGGYLHVTSDPGFSPIGVAARLTPCDRIVCPDAACDGSRPHRHTFCPRGRRVLWAGSGGLAAAPPGASANPARPRRHPRLDRCCSASGPITP